MKYGQRSVSDLYVFNKNGKLITVLDSLKESYIDPNNTPILYAKDALLDDSLLEFFNRQVNDNKTDYEKFVSGGFEEEKTFKTLVYRQTTKECKLIAKTEVRDSESGQDRYVYYEIPEASVSNYNSFNSSSTQTSEWDLVFNIKPYNEDKDLFKIHIEQDESDRLQKFFTDAVDAIKKINIM
ncbi:hypothetical protein [Paenibacillus silvae]|uniref:Uncharacterized protein n=1 Tax=Paenibacillus silvae TaxID=1325358 RepID=A0A2W6NNJ6_9BACL|nr:hypothetical protein [Paenibacillus silvae]PZT57335.1 hypothetical protein DN757_01375 [Paenibacillus silvae]